MHGATSTSAKNGVKFIKADYSEIGRGPILDAAYRLSTFILQKDASNATTKRRETPDHKRDHSY